MQAATPLAQAIRLTLQETQGNVHATADRLGVSDEYVRRLAGPKNEGAVHLATTAPAELEQPAWVLPQNTHALLRLRDATITQVQAQVDGGGVHIDQLIRLLKVLLEHEAALRAIARPVINQNLSLTQHTQHLEITALADKLQELLPEQMLRQVIDAEART